MNFKLKLKSIISSFLQFCLVAAVLYLITGFSGCEFPSKEGEPVTVWDTLAVTASAYNSVKTQTLNHPNITAWGDTIQPGDKIIAVSRDLINKGLDHNTRVRIEGFEGEFIVKDKMHYRWKNKIDIYMGDDVQRARKWGRKKLNIFVERKIDSLP